MPESTKLKAPANARQVAEFLGEVAIRVIEGEIDYKRANCLGALAAVQLQAIQQGKTAEEKFADALDKMYETPSSGR